MYSDAAFVFVTLGAEPADGSSSLVGSMLDIVVRGGWVMLPIAACSLVALAIILERFLVLRRSRVAPEALRSTITSTSEPARLLDVARSSDSPLGRVVMAFARNREQTRDLLERRVEEAAQREVLRFRRHMKVLSAMAPTATMLGLLGTVIGMIRTFTTIAASGDSLGKTERLAQGIYEAWTATAAGLAVAIPVLVLYHVLLARVDAGAATLDAAMLPLLEPTADAAPVRSVPTRSETTEAAALVPAGA